jgi:mannosidase alpha-like ER degradation enhancer 2
MDRSLDLLGAAAAGGAATGRRAFTYPRADGSADLLAIAADLGERLLPAFDTPTRIPYGTVNLRHGVPPGESTIACTAAAGSLTIEFEALSRLTGDRRFYDAAQQAVSALWARRSKLDLVGAHISIVSGAWTQLDSGVGRGIDSFLEYLLKAHLLYGDERALRRFRRAYEAVEKHTKVRPCGCGWWGVLARCTARAHLTRVAPDVVSRLCACHT